MLLGIALFACSDPPPRSGPPPIVLVSLDTFRADRVGAFGNKDGLTPNIDAFAAESTVFLNAYSQAVQTGPSHTSMFTSRYPSEEVGADLKPYVPKDMPLMAQLLTLYDYQTGAFVAGADLSEYAGLSPGFDTYEASTDFGSLYHTGPMALAWLKKISPERPYFMFVHGYDTHSRYLKPTPYGYAHSDATLGGVGQAAVRTATERIIDGVVYLDFMALMQSFMVQLRPRSPDGKLKTAAMGGERTGETVAIQPEDAALIGDVYDGAVSYADTMFGLLLAALQERGVLDDAWVILMADHGEQLGEHGLFGHCCESNDEETHVPIIIRAPKGAGGGKRVEAYVELVDLLPTIVEIAGVTPPARIHGRSLMPALRGEPFEGKEFVYTEGSEMMRSLTMRGPKGRMTYMGLSATSSFLPDLIETARIDGPGFTATEGLTLSDREAMRTKMVAWLRTLTPPPAGRGSRGAMPDALKKSLRDHGYWDVDAK